MQGVITEEAEEIDDQDDLRKGIHPSFAEKGRGARAIEPCEEGCRNQEAERLAFYVEVIKWVLF